VSQCVCVLQEMSSITSDCRLFSNFTVSQ